MNIEHLSHWSGQLNREMYLNRYGHAGIPVVVFASSGGSQKDGFNSSPFRVSIVKAGFVIGRILTIEQKCTELMNAM